MLFIHVVIQKRINGDILWDTWYSTYTQMILMRHTLDRRVHRTVKQCLKNMQVFTLWPKLTWLSSGCRCWVDAGGTGQVSFKICRKIPIFVLKWLHVVPYTLIFKIFQETSSTPFPVSVHHFTIAHHLTSHRLAHFSWTGLASDLPATQCAASL